MIFDLELGSNLIGRTRFCIHPKNEVKCVPIIGGTKNPNIQKIKKLSPDFVIANKEENRREDIEEIRAFTEVILTDISTVQEALDWIRILGIMLDASKQSYQLSIDIKKELTSVSAYKEKKCAYFIWKDPWMTAGDDTYIHDVMKQFGLKNVFDNKSRYPITDFEEVRSFNPELILLSSEPYPFNEKQVKELKSHFPESNIYLVDGEWFSWYGSRMLPSFRKLKVWRNQLG